MTTVNTALGPVAVSELGPTLSHEHLFINLMKERRGDGLLHDAELMTNELQVFADQGGRTIFDLTTAELTPGSMLDSDPSFTATVQGQTRDPANVIAVQQVSRTTGVNVVLGTGRYRDPFLPEDLIDRLGVDALADDFVRDIEEGFPGTSARAGVIGEIGADKWFISAREERVFRAAARAHHRTGVPIYTHAARWPVGLSQLALLREEGVTPEHIAIGHADTVPDRDFVHRLADEGVYIGIDTINTATRADVTWRVDAVMRLTRTGHIDRILLSHDVCLGSQLTAHGGNGFGFILGKFRTQLLDAGLTSEQFNHIVISNPAQYIAGRAIPSSSQADPPDGHAYRRVIKGRR
nr:hydrolase [Rhodococcus wratislaviensis]